MNTEATRTAWVTGASSGIGRAVALLLAQQGWRVIVSARNVDALNQLKTELANSGVSAQPSIQGSIDVLPLDVSDDSVIGAIAEAEKDALFDNLSLCIVCAGHCEYVDDVSIDNMPLYKRVFETNLFGSVRTATAAIPLLRATAENGSRAQLVFTSSLSNIVGFARAEAYGSSKAAVEYFANSLRLDVHDMGIDVSVVSPGFVETPMTDKNDFAMPFLMSSEKAAQRIVKAISKRPLVYRFPKRLGWLLAFFSRFPSLWYYRVGLALSKRATQ